MADDFEGQVATLPADVPCVLLPVRLETRYTANRRQLRIRVFPDTIHVDNHDPTLTTDERDAGQRYWAARWAAGEDGEALEAAWQLLVRSVPATRAAYLVRVLTPTNLDQSGTAPAPVFPEAPMRIGPLEQRSRAVLLPARWVVSGYRGDREVLRKWGAAIPGDLPVGLTPDPAAAPPPDEGAEGPATGEPVAIPPAVPPDAAQADLPIDAGLTWLVDYAEAERVGMAITVTDRDIRPGADAGPVADGFDRLVVLGVDWARPSDQGAARLATLFEAHGAAGGVSFLTQGTPTNRTDEAEPPGRLDDRAGADRLDPASPPPVAESGPAAASRRVARALGIADPTGLDRCPGAGTAEDLDAQHMQNALWEATWGYFLDQLLEPLVSDADIARLREHARRYVRGRGPLPCLRVGKQPYGLLPVVAAAGWRPRTAASIDARVHQQLTPLRVLWRRAVGQVARLGRTSRPDDDLLEVLATTPRSASFRFRQGYGPVLTTNSLGIELDGRFQERLGQLLMASAGITLRPYLSSATLADDHRRLTTPLVQRGALSETSPLSPNYITSVRQSTRSLGGYARLLAKTTPPGTLLHALLAHAAQQEVEKAGVRIAADFEVASGARDTLRARATPLHRELYAVEAETTRPRFLTTLDDATSSTDVALRGIDTVTGTRTIADHVAVLGLAQLRRQPTTRELAGFLDSLDHLAQLPTAALERLFTETIDCASHRLDAWYTSLATRRLDELREARGQGAHVGGFGWVEGLRPGRAPTSLGYVHAPSVPHAATTAILRSGHLSHQASDPGVLALDLTSARVRLALEILDGVREGQPLGALLGYRFERSLRERRLALARFILPFRRLAPLATSTDARAGEGEAGGALLETIAARDVVDGVRLLDRWRAAPDGFLTQAGVPTTGNDRTDVTAELERLADVLDAVSDLMLAESVHQMVMGNRERAGAALDALDRHTGLPDVEVPRTPRTGAGFSHRLLVLLGDMDVPPSWAGVAHDDPRAAAEPRLNAWMARVLGDPKAVRFAGEAVDADGAVVARPSARLSELDLSPLGTVLAAVTGSPGEASDLDQHVAAKLAAEVHDDRAVELRLLDAAPADAPPTAMGLGELRDLAQALVDLVSGARYATARDLAPDTERPPTAVDDAELQTRADAAVTTLRDAARAIDVLPADPRLRDQRDALLAAAAAGARGAVPTSADRDLLAQLLAGVRAAIGRTLDELDAAEDAFDRAAADPAQRVAHDIARLQAVFGAAFPVLPRFTAANGADLAASHADRSQLLDGDDLAPTVWLQRASLVRPAAARLADVLAIGDVFGRDLGARDLVVCQLPHLPPDRWLALPLPEDRTMPRGHLSLVAHTVDGFAPTEPLAGLVVDQWQERLPAVAQTTGLTVHYDAPGSRAPQSLLVAVPPDPAAQTWTFDALLGAVVEAAELTRLRLVDLQHVAGVGRYLPALWFPFNLQAERPTIDFGRLQNVEVQLANDTFRASGGTP